jgi:hypothetical protein
MTGGNTPKRHHFVPRAYLDRWAERGQVAVRPRVGSDYVSNPVNVAVRTGFYMITGDDGRPTPALEQWLAVADTDLVRVLRTIDQTGRPPEIGSYDHGALAVNLALQLARTPDKRARVEFPLLVRNYAAGRPITAALVAEYLEQVHLGFAPSANEIAAALDFVVVALRERRRYTRDFVFDVMFSAVDAMVPVLLSRHWTIEFDREERFLTSDRPVTVWRPPSPEDEYKGYGMENAREIRYPISPSRQLVLTRQSRPAPKVIVSPERVAACNEVVAGMCDAFVVGRPSNPQLASVLLCKRGPVTRFATGPLHRKRPDGTTVEDGDVLHMWEDRRQR